MGTAGISVLVSYWAFGTTLEIVGFGISTVKKSSGGDGPMGGKIPGHKIFSMQVISAWMYCNIMKER